ncbi:paralemmin 1a [Aulostomus maculatus]
MFGLQRTDLSQMETTGDASQQERLQLIAERRKWQTEIENKKRQLEDDRRALQHLKSKSLRERWLLDGAPSAGPEQDEVKTQLQLHEAKTRTLEDTINRLEMELINMETGDVCQSIIHTPVTSGSLKAAEVKGHSTCHQDRREASGQVAEEVRVHKSPGMNQMREMTEEMKKAMYSVEIKVERDKVTGETRVLSSHTKLPVDFSCQGVKVYEDESKVVHEMNGDDGVHLLSSSEVDELIHKAEEASMVSQMVTIVQTTNVAEEAQPEPLQAVAQTTQLKAEPDSQPSLAEASAEKPVTMVFMGYQNVEDEDETKKVLGLQGTVKAELVLIEDTNGKTSPGGGKDAAAAQLTAPPTSTKAPETMVASNGETAGDTAGGVVAIKEKQPCKCCSIM